MNQITIPKLNSTPEKYLEMKNMAFCKGNYFAFKDASVPYQHGFDHGVFTGAEWAHEKQIGAGQLVKSEKLLKSILGQIMCDIKCLKETPQKNIRDEINGYFRHKSRLARDNETEPLHDSGPVLRAD